MLKSDDSDMKIIGSRVESNNDEGINTLEFIEEVKRQRFNGNTEKAKTLGHNIISAFSYRAAPDELVQTILSYNVEPDDDILLQVRILSVFSAEYCLNNYLPSQMLSANAVSEMYEALMELTPDFFETLSRSNAFSFYYLCVKNSQDTAGSIAKTFARLCGNEKDEKLVALGRHLHELNKTVYKKAIKGFVFV